MAVSSCAQEVVGTDDSALQAVIAADAELMALRAEEAEIQNRLGASEVQNRLGSASLEDGAAGTSAAENGSGAERGAAEPGGREATPPVASTSAANDADNDRLAEIYDRLAVRAAPM